MFIFDIVKVYYCGKKLCEYEVPGCHSFNSVARLPCELEPREATVLPPCPNRCFVFCGLLKQNLYSYATGRWYICWPPRS